jgi:membrane associated rhomboid family serine protease
LGSEFAITKLFVGWCLAVFLMSTLSTSGLANLKLLGMDPREAIRWGALADVPQLGRLGIQQPWRYLSAMFVHFGALHIGFNMWALWDFGRATEQRLGSARFTIIFVGTGIVGFVASDLWFAAIDQPFLTAGASGGLFGLVGAIIGFLYARRDPVWKKFFARFAVLALIFAIALPVNNAAHIGGFVTGVPLGYLAYKETRPWRLSAVFGWVAALLVAASVVSVVLSRLYT